MSESVDTTKNAVAVFVTKSSRMKDARGLDCMYVLCPVMVPNTPDHDLDWITKSDLEIAAYDFSLRYSGVYSEDVEKEIPIKDDAVTGHRHRKMISKSDVAIVENYCLPANCVVDGVSLMKGTWMQGLLIFSEDIMKEIESGELTGLSVGGATKDFLEESPEPGKLF